MQMMFEAGGKRSIQEALVTSRSVCAREGDAIGPGNYPNIRLQLDERDNGLRIRAAEEARPVLSGGFALQLEPEPSGIFSAALPEKASANITLLVMNGKTRPRSRFP
jgi:hypothetical protein